MHNLPQRKSLTCSASQVTLSVHPLDRCTLSPGEAHHSCTAFFQPQIPQLLVNSKSASLPSTIPPQTTENHRYSSDEEIRQIWLRSESMICTNFYYIFHSFIYSLWNAFCDQIQPLSFCISWITPHEDHRLCNQQACNFQCCPPPS